MKRSHQTLAKRCCRWAVIAMMAFAPATALARQDEPEPDIYDARLEGYGTSATLPLNSGGLTWVVFIVLTAIAAAGLFKDAKRSHLD